MGRFFLKNNVNVTARPWVSGDKVFALNYSVFQGQRCVFLLPHRDGSLGPSVSQAWPVYLSQLCDVMTGEVLALHTICIKGN